MKIEYPILNIVLPITKKEITMHLMRLKEEKILLTAKSSNNQLELLQAMMICINNCVVDLNGVDLNQLSYFELQYIYMQLRSASVGKISKLLFPDEYNKIKKHEIVIDITNINFDFSETNMNIKFNETSGLQMRYPTLAHIKKIIIINDPTLRTLEFIKCCIKTIYNETGVYETSKMTAEELETYIDDLPAMCFEQLKEFINGLPKITYNIEYVNTQGEHRKIVLDDLENFT